MQKKVTNITFNPGFKENIYYPEVFRGLWITNRHFFVNMWRHTLNLFGIRTKVRPAVTYQYPEDPRPVHYRLRGRHRLTEKQNGAMRCTACMLCETICPCDCIHIVPGESPDPHIEKFPEEFTIDLLRCCYCGFCVEACPVDAIRMDVTRTEMAGYTRDIILTKELLLGKVKAHPWENWIAEGVEEKAG